LNHAEEVLLAHLGDVDSLDYLAREGFLHDTVLEIIPTELVRVLLLWALDYYYTNGRKVAPTGDAIKETWATELEQAEITLDVDTETDSIEWAVEWLRNNYASWRAQEFAKSFVTSVVKADPTSRVLVIQEGARDLYRMSQALVSRRQEIDAWEGMTESIRQHDLRAEDGHTEMGLTFGWPLFDKHTFGIHPGELAVVAAGSGVGKSWIMGHATLEEWERNRRTVLITLENDLPMTCDRLVCMKARVNYERWQRGEADEGDRQRVDLVMQKMEAIENRPIIIMPERGERTVISMVRKALAEGAQSIIIDQLSHIDPGRNIRERREQVSTIVRDLKALVNEGSEQLSCLLAHQVSREGKRNAAKSGRYVMEDLAETAEVERSADFVFTVYQSEEDRVLQQAILDTLKFRRGILKTWEMAYRLDIGDIAVRRELDRAA
jgi:replicative DNA helicase